MKLPPPTLALLLSLLVPVSAAVAGPLQRSHVSADAAWLVHLDVDRFKQTQLGQFVMGELDKPEAQAKFDAFQAIFSFDPRRSVQGCTLYSRGSAPTDAVLLLYGSFDANRLVTLAKAGKEYQSADHRGYVIHSYLEERRRHRSGEGIRTFGAIHAGGAVVFGQKESRVKEALDTLDRLQSSLEGAAAFSQWAGAPSTAFLLGAVRRTDTLNLDARAAFLKQCSQYSLTAGEVQGTLGVDSLLTTDSEETAANVLAMNQGLKALLAFQTDKPGAVRLAEAMSVSQVGANVLVSISLPANELVQFLNDAAAKQAAQP